MKYYFWVVAIILFAIVWIGFVGPYCISSTSNELVIGYIVASIIVAPFVVRKIYKLLKEVSVRFLKCLLVFAVLISAIGCSKVPAGNVGIKFYLLGQKKGVDHEELSPGRYFIGINEELYLFPTFTQNYVWTASKDEGSPNDESITFQTKEGMSVGADVGITYRLDPTKVSSIFERYKKGIGEITDVFLRNMVRDAFVQAGSVREVESVYGIGKSELITEVQNTVQTQVDEIGIIIEKIYLIGDMRLPPTVISALNEKITATQRAQQRENELREAEAAAKKTVAQAQGEAEANRIKLSSLSPQIIEWQRLQNEATAIGKWNGVLPQVTSGAVPFMSIK